MKKLFPCSITLAAVLCTSLLFSCMSDLELPPPPLNDEYSSSSPVGVSSSSLGGSSSSSSLEVSSSSSSSVASSSSSDPCAGFVDGTKREHYGKDKAQFCDSRDGKKYVYVTMGGQVWMAENLNYNATNSRCYDDNSGGDSQSNCAKYGRLYNWATAMANCPSGWHLPSNAEWNVLMKFVNPSCSDNSFCAGAGTKLKATSGWNAYSVVPSGSDTYGFSALPGGYGNSDGYFYNAGNNGSWWSASEDYSYGAYYRYMLYNFENVDYYYDDKCFLYSVRCLQD